MTDFKGLGKMAVGFALRSGLLDPVLQSVSDAAGMVLNRLHSLVEDVRTVYRHKQATGESPKGQTFSEFFTEYFNGVAADAVDSRHVDAQVLVQAAVGVLMGTMGSSSKYWKESLTDLEGFSKSDLGNRFHGFSITLYDQLKPVIMVALERVRADLAAARTWDETAAAGDGNTSRPAAASSSA